MLNNEIEDACMKSDHALEIEYLIRYYKDI